MMMILLAVMFGNMMCCQLAILRCMYGIHDLHYVASGMRRVVYLRIEPRTVMFGKWSHSQCTILE